MLTFYEFQQRYPDDESCLRQIMVSRYGGLEFDCPACGEFSKFYRMTTTRAYVCQHCKDHLHPTAGTFMHRTRLPLHKWFYAMYLFSTSKHGVAAKELERQLGVTYKCAWHCIEIEAATRLAQIDSQGAPPPRTYAWHETV